MENIIKDKDKRRNNYSGGFSEYINSKETKLRNQFEASISVIKSQIFRNICIHVNGLTNPPLSVLRTLILEHGGAFEQYFHRDRVTHFICTHVAKAKLENFIKRSHGKIKVMKPEWITDSIEAGKLLEEFKYRNYPLEDANQISIHDFFDKTSIEDEEESIEIVKDDEKANRSAIESSGETSDSTSEDIELLADMIESEYEDMVDEDIETDYISNASYYDSNEKENNTTTTTTTITTTTKVAAHPEFLNEYYKNSRLHHLSTWREELKTFAVGLMRKKRENSEYNFSSNNSSESKDKIVMHVDLDCFFVSASLLNHPNREALKNAPIAVTHAKNDNFNVADSSADISSCNYEARSFGIKNDMYIKEALRLCPHLQMIPYDFDAYNRASRTFYEILSGWASEFQGISCDEAFIELDETSGLDPESAAQAIRAEIKQKCQIDASIGIGPNMLIARLATRKAKPNGQFQVKKNDLDEFMQNQLLSNLPGVGGAILEKLPPNILSCQDIRKFPLSDLQNRLGHRQGLNLFRKARGEDDRSVGVQMDRKSVGSEVSWGVRFSSLSQCRRFMDELASEVWQRLTDAFPAIPEPKPRRIQVKLYRKQEGSGASKKHLGRGICDTFHRSKTFPKGITKESIFVTEIWNLFEAEFLKGLATQIENVRGIGIFANDFACNQKSTHKDILESFAASSSSGLSITMISASQIDSQVWPELPEEIRREFEAEWQKRGSSTVTISAAVPPPLKKTKITSAKNKNNNNNHLKALATSKTLTQMWGHRDKREAAEVLHEISQLPKDQFDHQVLLALPRELQLEIIAQWKSELKRNEIRLCDSNLVPQKEKVPIDPASIVEIVECLPVEFRGRKNWTCEQIYAIVLNNKESSSPDFINEIDSLLVNLILHECLKPVSDSCSILKQNAAFGPLIEKLVRLVKDLFNSELVY